MSACVAMGCSILRRSLVGGVLWGEFLVLLDLFDLFKDERKSRIKSAFARPPESCWLSKLQQNFDYIFLPVFHKVKSFRDFLN